MKLTLSPTQLTSGYGPMPGYRLWVGTDEQGSTYHAFILTVCSGDLAGQAVLEEIDAQAVPITPDMAEANTGFQELTIRALAFQVLQMQSECTRLEIAVPVPPDRQPPAPPRPPGKPGNN